VSGIFFWIGLQVVSRSDPHLTCTCTNWSGVSNVDSSDMFQYVLDISMVPRKNFFVCVFGVSYYDFEVIARK